MTVTRCLRHHVWLASCDTCTEVHLAAIHAQHARSTRHG